MKASNFFAADLGATSGRTILGTIADGRVEMHELTRFPNPLITLHGHVYWDLFALYREILGGLAVVAREGIQLTSIGIDTWGCDFVLFARDGAPLRNPYSYRDPHTQGAMEEYFKLMPREMVYEKTGIQFMEFNSLFQLATLRRNHDSALDAADRILFMPDALVYLLTGQATCERTVLSTGQLLDPRTRQIDLELIRLIGLEEGQFGRYVDPGTPAGTLTPEVQRLTGLGAVPVVSVAGHDTASAVAAVPAANERFAYLSCGTWSLLGIETPQPIITDESLRLNLTNEGGIEGTTRVLKNICGLWLLEQCRKEWAEGLPAGVGQGSDFASAPADIALLNAKAMEAEPFRSLINPDDPAFANPASMTEAICDFCRRTGQPVPADYRQVVRCIMESLALRYRQVLDMLRGVAPFPIEKLHVIGGGSRNAYLMQMTANSTGLPVQTGPVEGTALGNICLQAKAAGLVADRFDMRRLVAASVETASFLPQEQELWARQLDRFAALTASSAPSA